MITLYTDKFLISPYVFSCFVALKEKGIPFEIAAMSLGDGGTRTPEYKARTLTARVPALDHDGFVVAESTAIVEYLEDTFAAPKHARVLPAALKDRARARQLLSWLRSDDTIPIRQERPTNTMFYERAEKPLTSKAQAAVDKLLEVAERAIPNGKTQLFDAWSIADADLAFMLHRVLLNGDAVPAKARAFAEAQWKRPSVAEFVGRKRPAYVPY